MPDNVYFRQPSTQNMMLDILFIFCKLNPDIGYRQGMHEVLAPILWVVERDAVDSKSVQKERSIGTPGELVQDMFDDRFIEHDASTLFGLVMQNAKSYYAPADGLRNPSQPASSQNDSPMLVRSKRIFEEYLPKADPGLASHLVKIDIVPQIFLMRWIRLLFGREFPFDEVLTMWDIIFAEDPSLELVDLICVAMLLRIRWQLVEADTNTAFTLLLRYPEPPEPPYTFVHDALLLKQCLTPAVGSDIITVYGKKPPPVISTQNPGSSSLPNRTHSSLGAPKGLISQSSNLETLIQDAARGVYNRGEKWGVARAVRGAVGEVRKNVQALQSGPSTPRSGGREYRKPARTAPTGKSTPATSDILRRISALEARNKSLAKMLEGALSELWDCHKERSDQTETDKESAEALSAAIAKVQFVQVYLEDSTIPLPVEETVPGKKLVVAIPPPERTSSAPPSMKTTNNPVLDTDYPKPETPTGLKPDSNMSPLNRAMQGIGITSASPDRGPAPTTLSSPPTIVAPSPSSSSASHSRARPPLAQSSFSWMLGQDERTSAFASASVHTAFASDEKRRQARGRDILGGKGYLFGEDDDESGSARDGRPKSKTTKAEREVEEEVIDLGPLRKSAVA